MPPKATNVEPLVKASRAALAAGRRDDAIAKSRSALRASPRHEDALWCLAEALTLHDVYQHNPEFGRQLVADGSLAEAVDVRRRIIELGTENYENYLQIGYCLTVMGDLTAAAEAIRRATDLFQLQLYQRAGKKLSDEVLTPSFFIIGSQKCATTSLFSYISSHPLVIPPVIKEIHYFLHPDRGHDWYLSHFPRRPTGNGAIITGEASVSTINLPDAPYLVKEVNAQARIIALARNPIDRAISQYYNYRHWGIDKRPLEEAMDEELDVLASPNGGDEYWTKQLGYTWLGLYANDLERWLAVYPREQISILITEEMQAQPEKTVDGVFRFLGLPPHKLTTFEKHHLGTYDDQDQSRARERLKEFFRRPNERFFELIGRRVDWGGVDSQYPGPPVASASRARILFNQFRWKEAAEEFDKCLLISPAHPSRREWLEQSIRAHLNAADPHSAFVRLSEYLQDFPDEEWVADAQFEAVLLLKDPHATVRVLEDAIRRFPSHFRMRDWLILLSRTLQDLGLWGRAELALELLVAGFPEVPAGVSGLAQVAQETGRYAHAMMLWELCLQRFPGHKERQWWLVTYAHFLMREERLERAGQLLAERREEFPKDADGLSALALLEQKRLNSEESAALWAECLRLFPDHPDRRWWLPVLGNLLIDRDQLDEAELFTDEMMTCYPDEPGTLICLARIATKRQNPVLAAEIWEECLRRFPRNPERQWWLPTLGHLVLNMNEIERGNALFQQMLEEFPDDPIARAGLARALSEKGEWQRAAELWQECLDTSPRHPNRSEWENMRGTALVRLSEKQHSAS